MYENTWLTVLNAEYSLNIIRASISLIGMSIICITPSSSLLLFIVTLQATIIVPRNMSFVYFGEGWTGAAFLVSDLVQN